MSKYPPSSSWPAPGEKLPQIGNVIIIERGTPTSAERLLGAIFGESTEPRLTDQVMCECGKYTGVEYVSETCSLCKTVIKERKVLSLPMYMSLEEGKKWYQEHAKEWEYRPGWGYVKR